MTTDFARVIPKWEFPRLRPRGQQKFDVSGGPPTRLRIVSRYPPPAWREANRGHVSLDH